MNLSLDIHTAIQTGIIIAVLLAAYAVITGIRNIRKAKDLKFFRMRRDRMMRGWRLVFFAVFMVLLSIFLRTGAEPLAYRIFPPTLTLTVTPTASLTPTITLTPSITLSPTVTNTPSVTDTPTITPTPHVPLAVEAVFTSTVTPSPDAVFSPLQFAQDIDDNYNLVNPSTTFQNPVGHLYAQFSYDKMTAGVQWTALWYRGPDLVHYETIIWEWGGGGFGYTDWEPEPYEWLPGEYEVQIFVGLAWKVSGKFTIEGEAPTPRVSPTPSTSPTPNVTSTPTPSKTPRPTATDTPTPTVTRTRVPTNTFAPTITRHPTLTPSLSPTPRPTWTQKP